MKEIRFSLAAILTMAGLIQIGYAQNKASTTEDNLTLTVDIRKLTYPVDKVFFTYYNTTTKARYIDSAEVKDKKIIEFRTHVDEPLMAQIRVATPPSADHRNTYSRDNYILYVEPGKIGAVANDSLSNTTVTGSASQQDYLVLKSKEAPYLAIQEDLYNKYNQARKNKDSLAQETIDHQMDSVEQVERENVYKPYVLEKGQTSPVALYALNQYAGYNIDAAKAQPLYDGLGASVKALPAAIAFEKRLAVARRLAVGQPALEFTMNDTLSQPVSLSSFRGKYVLIDFWASWCGPCRAENPNVVKAYNMYKDKGFTVLGVSLDRQGQKDRWLKAIHDDKLTWTHVSDLQFWNNKAAALYDVNAIPTNFLVDKDGKIVAKNVRGEALEETLAKLLN